MNLRVASFMKEFNDIPLAKHFNLHSNISIFHNFDSEKKAIDFEIQVKKNNKFIDIVDLPEDINLEIFQYYSHDYININFSFLIDHNYPFKAPKLSCSSIDSSLCKSKIQKFVNFIIYETNVMRGLVEHFPHGDYSPAVTFDKEIICVLSRLYCLYEFYDLVPNQISKEDNFYNTIVHRDISFENSPELIKYRYDPTKVRVQYDNNKRRFQFRKPTRERKTIFLFDAPTDFPSNLHGMI